MKYSLHVAVRCSLVAFAVAEAADNSWADDVTIDNGRLSVRWHETTGRISMTARGAREPFLREARLSGDGGTATVASQSDRHWGMAQTIEVTYANGDNDQIALFEHQPFAFVRASRRNSENGPTAVNHWTTLSGPVDVGRPPAQLKTFGTGGLLDADKNPGSYAWLAVVDPDSRRGAVFGWLTHERGSGVLFTKADGESVLVDARLDYGRLLIDPGQSADAEILAVGYFDDARLGLEAWADAVATRYSVQLPPQPVGYCTWYSKPFGGASDETHLAELAQFAAKELAPYGFSVVQIDDKWQAGESTNGPNRDFTRHAEDGPYPHGMKSAAANIASLGLTPGLWYMPFAGTYYDPVFKDRQDWFVKRENGEPYETSWGGTCLDLTRPEVRDYVRSVADRIVHDWGFRYLKLDGLWTGTATKQQYVNSGFKDDGIGDAVFHDPRVTNIEAYRSGLRLVRETVGQDTFILGCNGPQNMRSYAAAIGFVDGMRVGPDNNSEWNRLTRGPEFGSRHYFMHGRVWYNDPDPVYVRDAMPLKHAQLVCSWVAISGQLNLSSEWLPGLPAERIEILQRTMPGHGLRPRPVDLFEHDPPRLWLVTDDLGSVRRDVIGVFNWDDNEQTIECSLERLGLDATRDYEAFDFWGNARLPTVEDTLVVTVPAQSCRILAVRPRTDHPQLLSTSRHVTQGIVDVREEQWDEKSLTLRGRSDVVADKPYELRIVVPQNGEWIAAEFQADDADISISQNADLVRAVFTPHKTGPANWSVRFQNR